MIIIIVLKLESRIDLRQGSSHVLDGLTQTDPDQYKIKMVIIIVLKLDLMINLEQG